MDTASAQTDLAFVKDIVQVSPSRWNSISVVVTSLTSLTSMVASPDPHWPGQAGGIPRPAG